MERLHWLALWDEFRDFISSSTIQVKWRRDEILEIMGELERAFIRKAERGPDRDDGVSLDDDVPF